MTDPRQDADNTTTSAHYLALVGQAGLAIGLPNYSGSRLRQRGWSPKLQVGAQPRLDGGNVLKGARRRSI